MLRLILLTLSTLLLSLSLGWAPAAHAGDDDGVSRREVKKVFEKHRRELKKCGVHLEFETTVRIKFKVLSDGRTKSFRVESGGLAGTPLSDCINDIVREMRFSKRSKSASVRHKVVIPAADPLATQEAEAPPPDAHLPEQSYSALIAAIDAKKQAVRDCKEVLGPDSPDRVVIRTIFTIDTRGVPDDIRIVNEDRRGEAVSGCVAQAIRKMRFPKEHKVTNLMYPFVVKR